jgi:hypothetical protein
MLHATPLVVETGPRRSEPANRFSRICQTTEFSSENSHESDGRATARLNMERDQTSETPRPDETTTTYYR